LKDFPSCTLEKSSAKSAKISTGKIDTCIRFELPKYGDKNKIPSTPKETAQSKKAILGRYCSLIFRERMENLKNIDIATIAKNSTTPNNGPVATNTTDKAAGRKIPKPLRPIKCLAEAINAAITGSNNNSTIVLAGTPLSTERRIAYLSGFVGQTGPNFCSLSNFSKGPTVLWLFWVKSGLGDASGVGSSVACGEALEVATGVAAKIRLLLKEKLNIMANKNTIKIINLRMEI